MKKINWRWFDSAFFGVRTLWFITIISIISYGYQDTIIPSEAYLLWGILAYIIPQLFMLPKYRNKGVYIFTEILITGSFNIVYATSDGPGVTVMSVCCAVIGLYGYDNKFWWRFSYLNLLLSLPLAIVILGGGVLQALVGATTNALALGVGVSFNRLVYLLDKTEEQRTIIDNQRMTLEQYANQVKKVTLLEERNKLAHDLHDIVGHTFTSLIIGIDGVKALYEHSPDKAMDKLDDLRQFADKNLNVVRNQIHSLAPDEANNSLTKTLQDIVLDFQFHTNTDINMYVNGKEPVTNQQLNFALFHCLQESITNAKRHGQATKIEVELNFKSDQITLTVSDNGIGAEEVELGFGLNGIQERLSALNGHLEIEPNPTEGMIVTFVVPISRKSLHVKSTS